MQGLGADREQINKKQCNLIVTALGPVTVLMWEAKNHNVCCIGRSPGEAQEKRQGEEVREVSLAVCLARNSIPFCSFTHSFGKSLLSIFYGAGLGTRETCLQKIPQASILSESS